MGFSTLRSFHSFRFQGEGWSKRSILLCDGLTFVQTSLVLFIVWGDYSSCKTWDHLLSFWCQRDMNLVLATLFPQTPRKPESVTTSRRKQTAQRRLIECTVIMMAVTVIIVTVILVVWPLQRWALVSIEWSLKLALCYATHSLLFALAQCEKRPVNSCYHLYFADSLKIILTGQEVAFNFPPVDTSSYQPSNLATAVTWAALFVPSFPVGEPLIALGIGTLTVGPTPVDVTQPSDPEPDSA